MEFGTLMTRYDHARRNLFRWRYDLDFMNRSLLALGFACLTGLLAQFRFYMPFTPVPLTGQVFAVLLSAVLLGKNWGGISQGMYVGLGVAGVPWFASWGAGMAFLLGPTGGYLIGFVVSAFFLGYIFDEHMNSRRYANVMGLMLFANFVIIYGLGMLHLYAWMYFVTGTALGLWSILLMGAVPFVAGDLIKVSAAAVVSSALMPKER